MTEAILMTAAFFVIAVPTLYFVFWELPPREVVEPMGRLVIVLTFLAGVSHLIERFN